MRFPRSRTLTCVIGIVTALPLIFSAAMLVSTPVVADDAEHLSMFQDVNQDGRIDIVFPSGAVYYNVGENRYRTNEIVFTGTGYVLMEYAFLNGTLAPLLSPASDMEPSPLYFLDEDGDGIPETIIFTNYGDLSMVMYRGDGTGTFSVVRSLDIQSDMTPDYIAVFDNKELKKNRGMVQLL
jgi:hypothetical protein